MGWATGLGYWTWVIKWAGSGIIIRLSKWDGSGDPVNVVISQISKTLNSKTLIEVIPNFSGSLVIAEELHVCSGAVSCSMVLQFRNKFTGFSARIALVAPFGCRENVAKRRKPKF